MTESETSKALGRDTTANILGAQPSIVCHPSTVGMARTVRGHVSRNSIMHVMCQSKVVFTKAEVFTSNVCQKPAILQFSIKRVGQSALTFLSLGNPNRNRNRKPDPLPYRRGRSRRSNLTHVTMGILMRCSGST